VTYKCEKNGRVSFADQPCDNGEKTMSVAVSEREPSRDHRRELLELKAKAAKMKSERLESERSIASIQGRDSNVKPEKALRCKQIDDEIALVDSQLRQPHSGQWGNQLNARRKKLTDLRFSINC
jgi:ribosomal protein L29